MKNKYNAKKTKSNGVNCDSKLENKYFNVLSLKKEKGEIKDFKRIVKGKNKELNEGEIRCTFELIPSFKDGDKKYGSITYTPDFQVTLNDGTIEYIETKGFLNQVSELYIKLFRYFYPDVKFSMISESKKYGDEYGFIDYYKLKKIRANNKKAKKVKNT